MRESQFSLSEAKLFRRRLIILALIVALGFGGLLARLLWLQALQ